MFGWFVVICDQINFIGVLLFIGSNLFVGFFGWFIDMIYIYVEWLRVFVHEVEFGLFEGVYVGFYGFEFEMFVEIKVAGIWGGDLVGMSTVLEAIAVSYLGVEVFGFLFVINLVAGMGFEWLDGDYVLVVAQANAFYVGDLLRWIFEGIMGFWSA